MDLATIEMPVEEAQAKFEEYRAAVRERHDDEDARIMRGYKAMAKGQALIRLTDTLGRGGYTTRPGPRGLMGAQDSRYALPRLAVAHAIEPKVYALGIGQDGGMVFYWNDLINPHATRRNIYAPEGTWKVRDGERLSRMSGWSGRYWEAMVPPVPPALRPARGLAGYDVLWEAEWRYGGQLRPPADPALLKRIGGDLYAVVATWDLTELEQAVLFGRT